MKIILAVAVSAFVLVLGWRQFFTVSYRGERIRLSYPLFDVDRFENAEHKLSPSQADRVRCLLLDARLPSTCGSLREAIDATHELVFPGYGSQGLVRTAPDGTKLYLTCVEIPEAGKDRCFLYGETNGSLQRLDDVVLDAGVGDFEMAGGTVAYRGRGGAELPALRDFGCDRKGRAAGGS